MKPKLVFAIPTVPSRHERAEVLRTQVGGEVFVDSDARGAAFNHLVCWKFLAYYASPFGEDAWGLVLEDDAEPVEDFREQVRSALEWAPSPVVSLYLGRGRPPHWQASISSVIARQEHWLMASEMLHGVAIAVRGDKIVSMLEEIRCMSGPVDERVGRWCRSVSIPISYSRPSLVDHADIPSVITEHETDQKGRYASFPVDERIPRRAWLTGMREHWFSSAAQIPDPQPL